MDFPIRPRAVKLLVKKLDKQALLPRFAHQGDACLDVFAAESKQIQPGTTVLVGTGLAMTPGPGWEIQVRSRSGNAGRGLVVANSPGTVEHTYRGELKILLHNESTETIDVTVGDRVAQLAVREVPPVEVEEAEDLGETERGAGGFGSTGT